MDTFEAVKNLGAQHEKRQKAGIIGKWFASLDSGNQKTFYISYSVFFLVMFACMYSAYFLINKTFIWIDDGLTQQYTLFVELGDWMRQFLSNVFVAHTFEVPMWSQELGYGQDYFIWVAGALGNPINWIAVFSDAHSAEFLLNLTVPITLFLAGVAFTKFAFYHDKEGFATLIGSMVFVFSGSTIVAFNQIFMVYPFLLAPMVFLGVDKVLDSKSPALFVIAIALTGLYSLNNAWMMCIGLLVYCVVRFVFMSNRSAKLFLKLFVKVFLLLVLGIAISAILFMPSAICILSQGRVSLERSWDLFYGLSYYPQIVIGFLKFSYVGSECFIGCLSVGIIAVIALTISRKDSEGWILLVLFIIATAFILFPFFGKIMNGFAYPNNRWIWMYALLVGYITSYIIPSFKNMDERYVRRLAVALTLATAFFMIFGMLASKAYYIALILLVGTSLCLLVLKVNKQRMSIIVSMVVSCGLLFGMWGYASSNRNVSVGQSFNMAAGAGNALAANLDGNDWRFDSLGLAASYRNVSSVINKNGTTFYNSMYNGYIDDYQSELGLVAAPLNFSTESMDGRTIMEQFAGVKYVMTANSQDHMAPAMYSEVVLSQNVNGTDINAHEADIVLPLAFLQKNTMSEDEFRALSPVEAQEALLQAAVVKGDPATTEIQQYSANLDFSFSAEIIEEDPDPLEGKAPELITTSTVVEDGVSNEVKDFEFETKNSAKIHFDVDIPANTEFYVVLEDLDFKPKATITSASTFIDRLAIKLQRVFPLMDNGCMIAAATEDRASGVWQTGKDAHLYSGKSTWAFCLGAADYDRSGVDITFTNPGVYKIGSMSVCAEDVKIVESEIERLCTEGADNIHFEGNILTCDVDVEDAEETLIVRLPYSSGWSAEVDGKCVAVENADIGFMGLKLDAGEHSIKLAYHTPGLIMGSVISAFGILLFAVLMVVRKKRGHSLDDERVPIEF